MNAVYKLIWNVSTGTWAVAHELAASRGKKTGRSRLAAAMTVALALPAGAAFAADSPAELQCKANESVSADGLRCEATSRATTAGAGTTATDPELASYIGFGGSITGGSVAQADGKAATALGANTRATGDYSIALGGAVGADANGPRGAFAGGASSVAIGVVSEARAADSVALGSNSLADRANTVSVGAVNNRDGKSFTRQIVNVADGTQANDAVNLGQMNTALSTKADDTFLKANANLSSAAAEATGTGATALGSGAKATLNNATAVGNTAVAGSEYAVALGTSSAASEYASMALGSNTEASGEYAVAIGGAGNANRGATSTAKYGVAIGVTSQAKAANAVALGAGSLADRENTISVGAANPNMDGKTFTRQIVNVGAGTQDNDAVNVSQLKPVVEGLGGGAAIDPTTGVVTGPSYLIGGTQYGNVGDALGNLDGRVTGNTTNLGDITTRVTNLENSGGAGGPGLVELDGSGNITVASKEVGGTVSLRDANGDTRTLTGVKGGTTRTDAVNFGQLTDTASSVAAALGGGSTVAADGTVTAPSYSIGGSDHASVGNAFDAVDTSLTDLDGRVGTVEGNVTNLQGDVTNLQGDITNISNGTVGVVKYDAASSEVNVATDKAGEKVNFAGTDGARTLAGVKAGVADTDAANFGQLKGTAQSIADGLGGGSVVNPDGTVTAPSYTVGGSDYNNVGDAMTAVDGSLTNIDGRVTVNEGNITTINTRLDGLADGTVGVVTYDAQTKEVNVATDKAGDKVNFAGTDGARTLAGVKAGVADTDAANFGQLKGTAQSIADGLGGGSVVNPDGTVTAPSYTVGGTTVTNVGDAITNIDGRTTTNTGDISNLTTVVNNLQAGVGGIVSYDAPTGTVQVAKAQAGDKVDFAGTAGDRTLAGVKAGQADTDAANVGQLKGTAQSIADGLGGGSVVNADGTISAPSYSIGGSDYANVGDAFGAVDTSLTNLDGRVTVNEGNITNINSRLDGLADGTAGLVTYDASSKEVNVATGKDGLKVNFAGTDGARVLAGVADGKVEDGSDEAVNGSQLNATNERVAANETSITNLDGRVTNNEGDINNLTTQVTNLSNGSAGLVTQDALTGNINVASQLGGDVVDMTGTAGARRVSGVANGVDDTDAATVAQLKASGLVDPNDGRALGALVYDDLTLDRATLGGTNGTVIGNLGNGLIAAGSREAVNGGQLFQMNADWEAKWSQLDGRVGTIEQGIADGSIGGGSGGGSGGDAGNGLIGPGTGEGSLVVGDGSADGTGSVAVGGGAAGGEGSVAIGGDSSATGDNSVAIGNGSTADRDNEFSVGSEGNERIVSNVGAGVRPTDAVNVQQMNDRFEAERKYVDDRFHSVDKRFDRMGAMSSAYAGMAINTAGLTGDNRVGAGVGAQNGRTALAVGYQRILGEKKNVSVSLGGAFSGSDKSVSAGAGYSW